MQNEDNVRSREFMHSAFDMNPQPFKSFFGKFINDRVGETGLTDSQIIFLTFLEKDKGVSLKEMSEKGGVHKSLSTRVVKHLITHGFVVNIAESRKEYSIILTEKGEKAKEAAQKALDELFQIVIGELTDEEFIVMANGLMKIRQRMEELSAQYDRQTQAT